MLPSEPPGKFKDFDNMKEYVISGKEFKSWNKDPTFAPNGLNAFYFKCTKPYKVEIEFIGPQVGVIDIVSWDPSHPQFEVGPVILHYTPQERESMKFRFYSNPFYLNRRISHFEPRVYPGPHAITEVRVTKLLTLKTNRECEYTLFLLKRAGEFLSLAIKEYRAADYGLALHFSRFVIEFSLKSMYTVFGMAFEREHGIEFSKDLRRKIESILPNFPLSKLLWICEQHAKPARIDFYGDELGFTPSYSFIEENEAKKAIDNALYCHQNSTFLLDNVQKANHK